jgi:phosphatidylglycerol lysyltransferase
VAYVFSHNAGLSFLGGGAVRFRLYSSWGLSATDIASVVVLNSLTFWLGFSALLGAALLFYPPNVSVLTLSAAATTAVGVAALALVATYVLFTSQRRGPVSIRGEEITLPSLQQSLMQLGLSIIDWLLAAGVLFLLLPDSVELSFAAFIVIYLLAQITALASAVPAGLGVFEGAILLGLRGQADSAALIGSLIIFRIVYYLLPLVVGLVAMGAYELRQRRALLLRVEDQIGRWTNLFVPPVLTMTTFMGGVLLLASGATPASEDRLAWVGDLLPFPAIELSHFAGSLAGVALLLLARGLQLRLDAAYVLSAATLLLGIVVSLVKGWDYEEALILAAMLAALLPCRRFFYRKASLSDEPLSVAWSVAIALVLIGTAWLTLFSFKYVEYSHDMWWQFELESDAPRALRAAVGGGLLLVGVGLARLLRPAPPDPTPPSPEDLRTAESIVSQTADANANLALLGDKTFLFNRDRTAFVMYGVAGKSWVALGDPVGDGRDVRELVWQFLELVDRHAGWTVFYEVGEKNLGLYVEIGLTLLKLGEEALVFLPDFSLEGGGRKSLRQHHQRMLRDGCAIEMLPAARVAEVFPVLTQISDAWLSAKHTREKGFSLGRFTPDYISRFPVAVVRFHGAIVAFANLWPSTAHEELSLDLMRYSPDAPAGVMDFLFVELMLWGRAEGYRYFNLGMAPMSGLEDRALAPLWNRIGAFLFRHGEDFYNFQGLRQYKEKFGPQWVARYIALPGGLRLPVVLANVAALIGGGLRGVVSR